MSKIFLIRKETILRREDGTRVRIHTELKQDYNSRGNPYCYVQRVDTCEKGRRTWQPSHDENSYVFRNLPFGGPEREAHINAMQLKLVTTAELYGAATELWEQMKP